MRTIGYSNRNIFFFFKEPATTENYTLSLHDALPIWKIEQQFATTNGLRTEGTDNLLAAARAAGARRVIAQSFCGWPLDRKSTRLNSSHANISYAVFCLKKKNLSISSGH